MNIKLGLSLRMFIPARGDGYVRCLCQFPPAVHRRKKEAFKRHFLAAQYVRPFQLASSDGVSVVSKNCAKFDKITRIYGFQLDFKTLTPTF